MHNPNLLLSTLAVQFHEGGPRTGIEFLQWIITQSRRQQQLEMAGNNGHHGGGSRSRGGVAATGSVGGDGSGGSMMTNGYHGGIGNGSKVMDRVDAIHVDSNIHNAAAAAAAAIPTPLSSSRAWLVYFLSPMLIHTLSTLTLTDTNET